MTFLKIKAEISSRLEKSKKVTEQTREEEMETSVSGRKPMWSR